MNKLDCVNLIERLRYHVATMKAAGNDGMVRVLTEAADTIERLWLELDWAREREKSYVHSWGAAGKESPPRVADDAADR